MTPTNELRFVERITYVNAASGELKYEQKVRILQQKWLDESRVIGVVQYSDGPMIKKHPHEWRDVPIEKEQQ
jgi:hypothetical protein